MKVVGVALIIDENNNFLIAQRPKNKDLADFWEFAGGKQEQNETIQECIIREIKEELNVDCTVGDFVMEILKQYPHGDFLLKVYKTTILNKESLMALEHQTLKWVKASELSQYDLANADKDIANFIQNNSLTQF